MNENDKIQIIALEMMDKDFEKLLLKGFEKLKKEQDKIKGYSALLDGFNTEDDIMTAYGYGYITEKKRDELIELFRKVSQGQDAMLEAPSPIKEYLRMLKGEISNIKREIAQLKNEGCEDNFFVSNM